MKLFAALLSGDDPEPGPKGLGQARAQMGLMTGSLDRAWEAMKARGADRESCQCVFVAPEFWFSNRFHQEAKFYDESIKKWIVDRLVTVSKNYPSVLIIPGTVLWCMKRRPGGVHVEKVKQRYEALNQYHKQTYGNVIKSHLPTKERNESTLNWIKGAQLNYGTWTHTPSDKLSPNATPGDHLDTGEYLIGANTAYISKGGIILKYHKIGNSAEVGGFAQNIVFMPGNIIGQFYVGNVLYGLEICMDHWLGIQTNSGAPAPDVQIITSSTTEDRSFNRPAKGVIVHATNRGPDTGSSSHYEGLGGKIITQEQLAAYDNRLSLDLVVYDLGTIGTGARPLDLLKPISPQEPGVTGLRVDLPRIR